MLIWCAHKNICLVPSTQHNLEQNTTEQILQKFLGFISLSIEKAEEETDD